MSHDSEAFNMIMWTDDLKENKYREAQYHRSTKMRRKEVTDYLKKKFQQTGKFWCQYVSITNPSECFELSETQLKKIFELIRDGKKTTRITECYCQTKMYDRMYSNDVAIRIDVSYFITRH